MYDLLGTWTLRLSVLSLGALAFRDVGLGGC